MHTSNFEKNVINKSRKVCIETCKNVFGHCNFLHIKPHFFKLLFLSQFLFDFGEILTNKCKNVCCSLWIFFWSIDFKYSRLKHKLKKHFFFILDDLNTTLGYLSTKVLSLYFVMDEINSALSLTCALSKFVVYKKKLESECKTKTNSAFIDEKNIKIGHEWISG